MQEEEGPFLVSQLAHGVVQCGRKLIYLFKLIFLLLLFCELLGARQCLWAQLCRKETYQLTGNAGAEIGSLRSHLHQPL